MESDGVRVPRGAAQRPSPGVLPQGDRRTLYALLISSAVEADLEAATGGRNDDLYFALLARQSFDLPVTASAAKWYAAEGFDVSGRRGAPVLHLSRDNFRKVCGGDVPKAP